MRTLRTFVDFVKNVKRIRVQVEGSKDVMPEAQEKEESRTIWEKIARACVYGLVFLLPIFFLPVTVFPVSLNKEVLFIVFTLVAFVSMLLYVFDQRKIVYPRSKFLSGAVILFIIASLVSFGFSRSHTASLWGDMIQQDSVVNTILFGILFYVSSIVFSFDDIRILGRWFVAGVGALVLFMAPQLLGRFILPWEFAKTNGFNFMDSVNGFGVFIAFGLIMIVSFWESERYEWKVACAVLGLLIFGELYLLRNSLLWASVAFVLFSIAGYWFAVHARLSLTLVALVGALFFMFFGAYMPSVSNSPPVEVRPSLRATFDVARQTLWWQRLLVGSGPSTFGYEWNQYRPESLNQTNFWNARFSQGFSYVLTTLVTHGVLGIVAFILFLFAIGQHGYKLLREKQDIFGYRNVFAVFSGVIFLAIALFLFPSTLPQLVFLFLGAGILASSKGEILFKSIDYKRLSFTIFVFVVILAVGSLGVLYTVGQKYVAAISYQKAIKALSNNKVSDSLVFVDRARRLDPLSDEYQRAISQILFLRAGEIVQELEKLPGEELSQEEKQRQSELKFQLQNIIAFSVQAAKFATEVDSVDVSNWSNLANVYENILPFASGADTFALESYEKASRLDPNNPDIVFRMGVVFFNKKDMEKAVESFEKVIQLQPNYSNAYYMLGLVKNEQGAQKESLALFEKALELNPANNQFLKIVNNLRAGKGIDEGAKPPSVKTPEP